MTHLAVPCHANTIPIQYSIGTDPALFSVFFFDRDFLFGISTAHLWQSDARTKLQCTSEYSTWLRRPADPCFISVLVCRVLSPAAYSTTNKLLSLSPSNVCVSLAAINIPLQSSVGVIVADHIRRFTRRSRRRPKYRAIAARLRSRAGHLLLMGVLI